MTPLGIEPRISGSVDQRLIHWATESADGTGIDRITKSYSTRLKFKKGCVTKSTIDGLILHLICYQNGEGGWRGFCRSIQYPSSVIISSRNKVEVD